MNSLGRRGVNVLKTLITLKKLSSCRLNGISNDEHITHIVELFAAEDRLVIAQTKVPEKKGEAKALPELLKAVEIKGAIVSMDALYCNIRDTQMVLNSGADYIVGIKGNEPKKCKNPPENST